MAAGGGTANLVPFKEGHDERRHVGRGRPSPLDDPAWVTLFAAHLTAGDTTQEIVDALGISERSVRKYKRDPRVKAEALRLTEDRILRITRKTDSAIERLLEKAEKIAEENPELLLKIRKEFLGGFLRQQAEGGKVDAGTIGEVMEELENDDAFATELQELLERAGKD